MVKWAKRKRRDNSCLSGCSQVMGKPASGLLGTRKEVRADPPTRLELVVLSLSLAVLLLHLLRPPFVFDSGSHSREYFRAWLWEYSDIVGVQQTPMGTWVGTSLAFETFVVWAALILLPSVLLYISGPRHVRNTRATLAYLKRPRSRRIIRYCLYSAAIPIGAYFLIGLIFQPNSFSFTGWLAIAAALIGLVMILWFSLAFAFLFVTRPKNVQATGRQLSSDRKAR